MENERGKKIKEAVEAIFNKAEAREEAGGDHFEVGWQATLEIMLLGMQQEMIERPGDLLPMQVSGDEEWDFYLDVLEKLDLPPDTGAVLITPSAFKDMPLPRSPELEESGLAPWKRNAYSVIISKPEDYTVVLQAALPGIEYAGIDIFEDGKHIADYMYNTVEECLDDLASVTWTYFGPKGDWSREQIIRYTENWHAKSMYGLDWADLKLHREFSYIHHPELIGLTPLEAVFKIIEATIPKNYHSLDKAIKMTNDLNKDLNLGEPVVTKSGILKDDPAQCQALMNSIVFEIDNDLEMLELTEGAKMPVRNFKDPEYAAIFDETAKEIYKIVTGSTCPGSVKVE